MHKKSKHIHEICTWDIVPVSSKEFLEIHASLECTFTLKCVRDVIIMYSLYTLVSRYPPIEGNTWWHLTTFSTCKSFWDPFVLSFNGSGKVVAEYFAYYLEGHGNSSGYHYHPNVNLSSWKQWYTQKYVAPKQ